MRSGFSRHATMAAAVVVAGSMAACGSTASTTESQGQDHPVCQNWDKTDFTHVHAQSQEYTGSKTLASAAYALSRCSAPSLEFTDTLRGEIEKYANASESDETVLQTIYGGFFGAEGLYAAWSALPRDAYDKPLDSAKEVAQAQEDFSHGLAAITDPGNPVALGDDYVNALRELGNEKIPLRTYEDNTQQGQKHTETWEVHEEGETVYGWTVLAPLLRHGEFHEDFLIPIATDIVEFDQKHDSVWNPEGEEPVSLDTTNPQAQTGMEAVLEALNRNQTAAAAVAEETGDERVAGIVQDS